MIKKPLGIAFAPNAEYDDAIKSLSLFGAQKPESDPNLLLEEWFKHFHKKHHAFSFSSGRAAFYAILCALELPKNSQIAIQAFTCIAVTNSVSWAGHTPLYIDIDKTLNMSVDDLEKKITKNTRVVVVQHTFGIPADIEKIAAVAKKNNCILIEDCAHALGAKIGNIPVGSFGDVSFFSFGRDKVVSSVFGGIVITNNELYSKKLIEIKKTLTQPPYSFVAQQLLYAPLYTIALFLYPFLIGKLLIKLLFGVGILSKAVSATEKMGGMPTFIKYDFDWRLASLALHQCEKLEKLNNHRRQLAKRYLEKLSDISILPQKNDNPIYLRYPIFFSKKDELLDAAKKKGIILGNWYSSPVYPSENDDATRYEMGVCPQAEKASTLVVNLPTSIHTTTSDVDVICDVIKKIQKP